MQVRIRMLVLCWFPIFLLGCVSGRHKKNQPAPDYSLSRTAITELNLLAIPVALNLDAIPGPDGFVVKIYAGNRQQPKPVAISQGTLDILMYDGVLTAADPRSAKPRRIWTFKAEELKRYELTTSIGTGYQLSVRWEEAKPARDKITAIARYTSPEGVTVYSAPSVISVTGT